MKIHSLTLSSPRLDAQQSFFADVLGFPVERMQPDLLKVRCGETELCFRAADRSWYYHYCFLIPPGCLAAVIRFLDERELEPLPWQGKRIVDFGNGRAVYFHDADGNVAEFIERPSLGHPEQESFGIQDVIRLNEIGLPCRDPLARGDALVGQYGIRLLGEASRHGNFYWCGDFEGVLLLPRLGRAWMPLDRPCEANPARVDFETPAGRFLLEETG